MRRIPIVLAFAAVVVASAAPVASGAVTRPSAALNAQIRAETVTSAATTRFARGSQGHAILRARTRTWDDRDACRSSDRAGWPIDATRPTSAAGNVVIVVQDSPGAVVVVLQDAATSPTRSRCLAPRRP